jgi:hypothetical protein
MERTLQPPRATLTVLDAGWPFMEIVAISDATPTTNGSPSLVLCALHNEMRPRGPPCVHRCVYVPSPMCCLREIGAYILLLPRTTGAPPIPLRLTQLCQSPNMQNFLSTPPPIQTTKCLVTLGLVFWLDGWDPSASSKNNRPPIHTASVTLLCIDNLTGVLFNARTFPFACGPGKADHNIISQALRHSLDKVQASAVTVRSDHHGCWTTLRAHVIAFLMDQPERRGTNCLLGGNSKQHIAFGVSSDFENLERKFLACPKCVRVANRYLKRGEYASPMAFACWNCYSFSLTCLFQLGKYLTPCHLNYPTIRACCPSRSLRMLGILH